MSEWTTITPRVRVKVGDAVATLVPPREVSDGYDSTTLGWAWMASATLTVRLGDGQLSKRVKAKHVYPDLWEDIALDSDLAREGLVAVVRDLKRLIARHGVHVIDIPVHARLADNPSEGIWA